MNNQSNTPYISELASAISEQFSYHCSQQRKDSHSSDQHPPATESLPETNPDTMPHVCLVAHIQNSSQSERAVVYQPTDSHGSHYGHNTGEHMYLSGRLTHPSVYYCTQRLQLTQSSFKTKSAVTTWPSLGR
jgi:hypothetical protein